MARNIDKATSKEVGAPDSEFLAKASSNREALQLAFEDWRGRYDYALSDGGTGDVVELLAALIAAVEKSK